MPKPQEASTDSAISRRSFLAAGSAALLSSPLMSTLSAEPISSVPPAPAPVVLRPFPRTRIKQLPAELLKHVHPDVRYERIEIPAAENALMPLLAAIAKCESYFDYLSRPPYSFDVGEINDSPLFRKYEALESQGGEFPDGKPGDAIRDWIKNNEPAVTLLDDAVHRGRLQFYTDHLLNYMADLVDNKYPLRNFIGLTRFLSVRIRMLLADEDHRSALAATRQFLALGRMIAESESFYVHCLKGIWAQRLALELLGDWARQGSLPDQAAAALIQDLPRMQPGMEATKQMCRVEFCYFQVADLGQWSEAPLARLIDTYIMRAMYYGVSQGNELKNIGVSDEDVRNVRQSLHAILRNHPKPFDQVDTVKIGSKLTAEKIAALDRPDGHPAPNSASTLAKELAAWPSYLSAAGAPHSLWSHIKPDPLPSEQQLEKARQELAKVADPVGKKLIAEYDDHDMPARFIKNQRALFAATRIILASRRKLDRDGALPAELTDLVREKWLDALPVDPFNGEPFGYSRERGLMWSVGQDGKNDNGDWNFEANPPDGKDLVWRLPKDARPGGAEKK